MTTATGRTTSARAQLVYDSDTKTLRTIGGTLLLSHVTLDRAAVMFTGYVITVR